MCCYGTLAHFLWENGSYRYYHTHIDWSRSYSRLDQRLYLAIGCYCRFRGRLIVGSWFVWCGSRTIGTGFGHFDYDCSNPFVYSDLGSRSYWMFVDSFSPSEGIGCGKFRMVEPFVGSNVRSFESDAFGWVGYLCIGVH